MPRILLVLSLALLAPPLWATPCEAWFRDGLLSFLAQDRALRALRVEVYGPGAWVNATQVLARLEARSALTDQCGELASMQTRLAAISAQLDEAERQFRIAAALCFSTNRERAHDNLALVRQVGVVLADEVAFLNAVGVTAACRPP